MRSPHASRSVGGRGIIALGVFLASAGECRTNTGRAPSTTLVREGVFDYWADAQRYELRGIVRLTGDTVVLEPRNGTCRPAIAPRDRQIARYECSGPPELGQLELSIDRQNPQLASRWRATIKMQKQRMICAQDAATDDGQRICMRYETQTYEETVTRTGSLRIRPRREKGTT